MGILQTLGLWPSLPPTQVESPWARSHLESVVVSDLFDLDAPWGVTRAQAMRVAPISRGRDLICGTLSRYPLATLRAGERVALQPAWLSREAGGVSPQARILWTLDDLIFYGESLWAVTRGAAHQITDGWRVPYEDWSVNADSQIEILGTVQPADAVIYVPGPKDPLLTAGAGDIRAALDMRGAWSKRVASPVPLMELHATDSTRNLTPEEATELVGNWEGARKKGGTAYTPAEVELRVHGQAQTDLYVQGRNAARLDFANFLNLPASMLDGSTATASLTYVTQEGNRAEYVDISLAFWANAIEARLSMDDVVPAGQRVEFDLSWLTAPSTTTPGTGPVRED